MLQFIFSEGYKENCSVSNSVGQRGKKKKKDLKAISSDCLDTRTNTSACENDLDFIPAHCKSISSTLDL